MSRRVPAFVRGLVIGALCFAVSGVAAQSPPPAPLDPGVIASVDRIYPGFIEILETGDSPLLSRLARTLVANPGSESLEDRLDGRGYSMFFERRGERWVYLFSLKAWIS